MNDIESLTVWPWTEHQMEVVRGLFHRELKYETKIIAKIGMTSKGILIVECLVEGEFKTFTVSREAIPKEGVEKYLKSDKI